MSPAAVAPAKVADDGKVKEYYALAEQIETLAHLKLVGLMTMAPFTDNPKVIRPCFKKLRKLLTMLQEKVSSNQSEFKYLSMGMSQDFELAVEEGAHILRIGTALFEGI